MQDTKKCTRCGVFVAEDLSNCPLCGKFVGDENKSVEKTKYSYPDYSFKGIVQKNRWVKIVRAFCGLAAFICLVVNLLFKTTPYWFPYALIGIFTFYIIFISPFKGDMARFVKNIKWTSIFISAFFIFIDAYNSETLGATFGWGYAIVVPCVLTTITIVTAIICFCSKSNEMELLSDCLALFVYSVIYFIVKFFAFPFLPTWPSLMYLCVAGGWFVVLEIFKSKKFWRETLKKYHI